MEHLLLSYVLTGHNFEAQPFESPRNTQARSIPWSYPFHKTPTRTIKRRFTVSIMFFDFNKAWNKTMARVAPARRACKVSFAYKYALRSRKKTEKTSPEGRGEPQGLGGGNVPSRGGKRETPAILFKNTSRELNGRSPLNKAPLSAALSTFQR